MFLFREPLLHGNQVVGGEIARLPFGHEPEHYRDDEVHGGPPNEGFRHRTLQRKDFGHANSFTRAT